MERERRENEETYLVTRVENGLEPEGRQRILTCRTGNVTGEERHLLFATIPEG